MSSVDLLSRLRSQEIHLWAENDRLRYSAPEGVITDDLLAEIRTHKDELLELLNQTAMHRQAVPLIPVARTENLRLSFAQQRLWFLHQLEPESSAYNIPLGLRLSGNLDIDALQKSLQALIDRHESMRTSFPDVNGQPTQLIAESLKIPFKHEDLQALPEADREATARKMTREEALRPFVLATGPLVRAILLQLSDREHVLQLTMHHIISDGWSLGVLSRELTALYEAFIVDEPNPLAPLPIQYVDFAHWQREWLKGEVFEQQLSYWREQLKGLSALELSTDRPRPPVQTYIGASHSFALDRSLADGLHRMTREAGVTLAVSLLAAFKVLLAKYTGQTDLAVGSPIANRNRQEIEGLIGFFVNSLVMRTDLSGNPSFREVIARVQEVSLGAYDHQDLPFEQLVEELQPERDLSRNPLFQIMFAVQNAPFEDVTLPGLTVQRYRHPFRTTRLDLECHVWERPEGLEVVFVYNTDLFDPGTIERLGLHFRRILEIVVEDPQRRLAQISVLEAADRAQLLEAWNATQADYPPVCLHELVEAQAALTPSSVAVEFEDRQLTYEELNNRANQLAHHLCRRGIGPGTLVGIFMHRAPELLVGLLGVLKAGGAYVPLDPAFPAERLAFMAADSGVKVVLTQQSLIDALPSGQLEAVCLDADWQTISQAPSGNPVCKVTAEHVAYVIYTSGSTGTPKGVEILHRGVANFLTSMVREPGIKAQDTLLSVTTLSFDIAVLELFLPLVAGARVRLVSRDAATDAAQLSLLLADQGVTVMQATPATWRMLMATGWQGNPQLQILCGGEALPRDLAEQLLPRGQVVWNLYGPTEATIWSTLHRVTGSSGLVPVGRPIANTRVYILDRFLEPAPIGVSGELYLGGDGLARGYYDRPALTAQRFIPHPYSDKPGDRLYRTGDIARYLDDGTIQCLGRVDSQVKIRGYRIELGEIEAVLTQHPAITESAVLVREDEPGTERVVAYVVPDIDEAETLLRADGEVWNEQHVTAWQTLWGQTYDESPAEVDPTFNITGWGSAYTGDPIPADEMREWVEATVERILGLRPQRILEIGCGTGLLLYRLAPHCREYIGTDFSQVALQSLRQGLAERPDLTHVVLEHRAASDFSGIGDGSVDTVVINSVIQYLPGMDYLLQVLEGAVRAVKPGGQVVVGDVRSLPLLTAYHASIQLHQAKGAVSTRELAQQIQHARAREEELVIDPEFFSSLADKVPRIGQVEVLIKRGKVHNELTRFRYDVILHVEPLQSDAESQQEILWKDWAKEKWNLRGLQAWLQAEAPAAVGFTGIPNGRLQQEMQTLAWLAKETRPATVDALRQALADGTIQGVDPQAFWDAVSQLPYWCELGYSGSGHEGMMVGVLRRRSSEARPCLLPWPLGKETPKGNWKNLGTNPLKARMAKTLTPQLRSHLEKQLPEYMIPSAFVTLDGLPLTPNRKVDRKALPAPEGSRTHLETLFVAPQTATEEQLAQIWQDVLGLEQVGIQDNFFELGGHSLMATQVISRVRALFQIEIPLRHLFEDPTIESLARVVENERNAGQAQMAESIVPLSRTDTLPLSFAQQRLWFLEQLEPGSTAYVMPYAVRLRGSLDLPALVWSLDALVQRHESLRTIFAQDAGEPVQVILPSLRLTVPEVDLQALPEAQRESEMQRLRALEAQTPFELEAGPLVRARFIRMCTEDHVLLLTLHHIISDAWSMGVFFEELESCYQARCAGTEPDLPPLPLQYADYAGWQREYLQGERLEREVDYWRKYLEAPLPILRLPTDSQRPSSQSHRGARRSVVLSAELKAGLLELSHHTGTTPFMTLLAIFQLLLHRLSGQDDVCVGMPSAGRTRVETEDLIGFFINTLTLRTTLVDGCAFREFLMQVRNGALGAHAHQTIPFEKLVEVLQPDRDLNHTPVFQAFFNMLPSGIHAFSLPGVGVERMPLEEPESKFDLTLYVQDEAAGTRLNLVYNVDLFKPERIEAFLDQFCAVAEQVVQNPDQPLDTLSLVTPRAQSYLPDPKQPLDVRWDGPAWQRLASHAGQRGEATAIVGPGQSWTYEVLENRSNQLAHYLLEQGIKSQAVVAIFAARSPELVLALLGVLKAGAAFMILDPSYPPGRLAQMLEIAKPGGFIHLEEAGPLPDEVDAWVTEVSCRVGLPAVGVAGIDPGQAWDGAETAAPEVKIQPEDVAYVTFTSGTTGSPKCIQGTHRPLSHFVRWYSETLQLTEADRVTMFSGLAHDPLLRDVFTPLWTGGTLCIPDAEALASGRVGGWMNEQKATLMHLTPSLVDVLTAGGEASQVAFLSLRYAVFGGERLRPRHVESIRQLAPQARCVNGYGATETPQIVCWHRVPPELPSNGEQVPIGEGIDGVQIFVLNSAGQLAGIGELGEICVRTPYLTQGYVNDEALTSMRFVPNPFRPTAGDRIYRTGDMGRLSPDGTIEFAGRRDSQVKVRGFRVELGEVEVALGQHPAIAEVVVTSGEGSDGDCYLAAYLVTNENPSPSISDLRSFLRRKMPDYMVPSSYVYLDSLPRTPNGKVDHRSLPKPDLDRTRLDKAFVAPQTPTEETLAEIWQETLGLERVGIEDNFFELGGHSLIATQVMSRARDHFKMELPLLRIFETPTIAGLTELIETIRLANQAPRPHRGTTTGEREGGEL